ncbi:armadillo-type protein [Baffinella frigidus]|nr:armadillo-type protein [Cryptophyta sp. CCMP2293]
MSHLDLGKYEAGFRALPVNGAMLAIADHDDLREAGVEAGMHRKELMRRLEEFRVGGVPLELLDVDALLAKRVLQSEDIGFVIRSMWEHLETDEVLEAAFDSLGTLARKSENQDALVAKGGVEAVVWAMGVQRSSVAVQEGGCCFLANLAANNEENAVAVTAKGGIEAVVRAMGAHGWSEEVQVLGCGVFLNLASPTAENAVVIAANGGVEAVVRAMGAHASSWRVQENGCWALANIVRWGSELQSQVREAGAIPLVEKALSAFPCRVPLQEKGKRLMKTFSEAE